MQINKDNFEAEVLKSEKPVVVEFYRSEGCGNCTAMKPIMERFEKANPLVKVCYYECGKEPDEITSKYQFKMFPGIFSFKDGGPVRGFSGVKSLNQLSLLFLLPNALKVMYYDYQDNADFIKRELAEYNQGTQVIQTVQPPVETPVIVDPADANQKDCCQ